MNNTDINPNWLSCAVPRGLAETILEKIEVDGGYAAGPEDVRRVLAAITVAREMNRHITLAQMGVNPVRIDADGEILFGPFYKKGMADEFVRLISPRSAADVEAAATDKRPEYAWLRDL